MLIRALTLSMVVLLAGPTVFGAVYNEDFEGGSTDWVNGSIKAESSGNHYFEFLGGGSYSFLGGSRSNFGGGWYSSVDVYIDLALTQSGYGFEVTQAINNSAGNFVQENLFHVGAYETSTGGLAMGLTVPNPHHATSGEGNPPAYYVQTAYDNGGPMHTFGSSGWYTLGWQFAPSTPDTVEVYWALLDDSGNLLHDYTGNSAVSLSQAGGNRYMWFIGRGSDYDSLMIDNATFDYGELPISQTQAIPEPLTLLGLGSALVGLGGYLRRRKA